MKLKSHVIEGVKTTRTKRLRKRECMEAAKIGPDPPPHPPPQKKTDFCSAQGSLVAEMRFFINL